MVGLGGTVIRKSVGVWAAAEGILYPLNLK